MNIEFKKLNGRYKTVKSIQGSMELLTRNNRFEEPIVLSKKGRPIAITYYRLKDRPRMKWRRWKDFQARIRRDVWYDIVFEAIVE